MASSSAKVTFCFGTHGEGYLRLVFANSDDNLKETIRRIKTLSDTPTPD